MYFPKNPINHLIDNNATIKETINPVAKNGTSPIVRIGKVSIRSFAVAANITGTATINENSAANLLSIFWNNPPTIVEADLDIPGHNAKH
mgnify:CR=1 FL=1